MKKETSILLVNSNARKKSSISGLKKSQLKSSNQGVSKDGVTICEWPGN